MKCPNPKCQFSGLENLEETANFCPRCGWNLRQSEEASSSLNEKNTTVSENPTRSASESEDRRFDPQDSTVEADGPCKKTVENLGKHKPGEITSSESVLQDTTAVASQSFCLGKKTEENQEEDHDPTKEISHVSPSDSTLNLSCEEFASSNSPVVADGSCKETVEHLGKQKPGEITPSQSVFEDIPTAVASQSLCHEEKTEENHEEDHDPTKEVSHVSQSDSTLNLSCEEFASSISQVVADGPCKETVEDLGKQKPGEITSSQLVLEDTTAVSSQSLCHEKKTEENQEEDCDPTKEISHVPPSDSTLNLSSKELASSNSPDDTLDDDAQGTVGSTHEAVAYTKAAYPFKTDDSSKEKKVFPVTDDGHKIGSESMNSKAETASNDSFGDKNTNDGENQFNRDVASLLPNDSGSSQSMDSHAGTVSSQCDNGSIGNNTDDKDNVTEKETGCQESVPEPLQGIKSKALSLFKSKSKKKRERKKERKKNRAREKKEEAQREAAQNENKRQSSVSKPGPLQKEMSDNVKKNNDISVPKKLECEIKGTHNENSVVENGGNHVGDNANSEYFWKDKGSKMTVVFYAVLAPHFKFSAHEGDKIYMRFGGPAFGTFNDNVVEVHPGRMLENDFILVQAELLIPCSLLPRNILYKYIVVKANSEYSFEHLVGFGAFTNRCLLIPKERCKAGDVWHQYDDTIFSPPNWLQSFRNMLPAALKSMDAAEGRRIATRAMLPSLEGFTGEGKDTNAWKAVEVIQNLASCMTNSHVEENGRYLRNVPASYDFREVLKQYLKERILQTSPLSSDAMDKNTTWNRLLSSVIITYVVHVFNVSLDLDDYRKLFLSLVLSGNLEEKTCPAFDVLVKHFDIENWRCLGEAMQAICKDVAKKGLKEWFHAVPFVHFLTGASRPFSKDVLLFEEPKENDDSWWGAVGFETKILRERNFPENSCLSTLVESLSPLFELDPLFRRTFLLATPCSAYDKIASSERFCPFEIYTTLAKILSEEKFLLEQQREKVASSLKITRENAVKRTSEIAPHGIPSSDLWAVSTQEANLCAKSCLRILKTVSSSCKFNLLLECLQSMAMWVAILEKVPSLEADDAMRFKESENMVKETIDAVKKWLKKSLLVQIPCYTTADTNKELQIWTNLLDLGWGNDICNDLWSFSFSEAFKFRLEERKCNDLVEVLTKAEVTTQNNCVRDLVCKVTFRKVENLLQWGNESKELFENLWKNGLNSPEASKCGELFTLMLTRCWPKPKEGIPCSSLTILKHVLEWKLWPCFFHRFGPESGNRKVIKDDGLEILVLAESSLGAAVGFLKDGSIELQVLEVIIEHSEQFLKLCELINDFKSENLLRKLVDQRSKELRAFRSERDEVYCFIRMCVLIKQVDLDHLSTKSGVDTSSLQIRDLVESIIFRDTVIPKVTFFGLSHGAKMMVSTLSKLSNSALLRQFWKEKGEELRTTEGRLTIDDVEQFVWTPSYEHLLSLKDRFLDGSISFEEVDKILAVFAGDDEGLVREIYLITSQTSPQIEDARASIDHHIEKINQYRNLQNCIDAAESMLVFKNCFELEGDFQLVEDLKNQMGREFKRRPLKSMNPTLQATGESLSKITPNGRACLDAVVECKKFIAWLQKTIKGPQELKVLVDLAIISAAETDIETARITCLHTSCLGFAPLIFVKPDFGFDDVMKACKPVWDAVESDHHLPQKLIDTSRQLEWLKGVETSHGSVAKSSLLDAQAINESGVYRIGCLSKDGSFSTEKLTIDKVIQLSVPQGTRGEHKCYSLDELKDLQSKLMLIAAKASKGKEEVDRFVDIFQSVVRLGEAYISLCKAGEVSHLEWTFEFKCTARLTGSPLQANDLASQIDEMEECLKMWKNELHRKRLHYKELNHYTTMQLLFLRSKLANLRSTGPKAVDEIPLEVYNLLESVLPDVEPGILKSVLIPFGICSQETGQSNLMPFGGGCTIQQSAFGKPLVPVKNLQSSQEDIFQSLVAHLESIGSYPDPEEIAIAAMLSCKDASETDLIVWCVKNGSNEDLICSKYSEALLDPSYCALVDKDASVSIKGESPYEKETSMETEDLPHSVDSTFVLDQTAGGEFLSLDDVGNFLTNLASMGPRKLKRRPSKYLIPGKPNFVVIPKDDIFGTVLSLYMHDDTQSLPSSEEVLICTSDTTAEEIELLWRRCLGDHDGGLFCLVNVDVLDYSVSQKAADTLSFLLQEYNSNEELCLVIFCCSENEDRAHMAAALDQYRLGTMPYTASPKEIRQYLKTQFKACPQKQGKFRDQNVCWTPAGTVDKEKMSVRVFSSERAGSGKTLAVHRLNQNLRQLRNNDVVIRYSEGKETDLPLCIAIPIYGPAVNHCSVVESFLPHMVPPDQPLSRIFHIDVHPSVTNDLDTLLFNLLVLGVLKSSGGKVWRRRSSDLYVIELTTGPTQGFIETEKKEMSLFKNMHSKKRLPEPFHTLLPTIYCGTPEQALLELKRNAKESLSPRFDDGEFRSQHFQRSFQYLKLWETAKQDLDHFCFVPNNTMGDYADCLEILMRNCGIMDPSWAELRHFVNFLNSQLQSCEESTFCNMEHVGDTLEGFRSFVVNFMILMSQDFATPSLNSSDPPLEADSEDEEENVEAAVTQFCLRRHWETSSHPYIFFNQDRVSMTFVGFHIDRKGNLIDPDRREIIKRNLMSRHLRTGLTVQFQFGDPRMSFETNYRDWTKGEKIEKLCGVMGVEWPYDPDNSYELTTDNLMKILAIHMRFRCGIPVVIMGETGCGKTCLIRYMCGLQSGPGGPKNMLLMKVHGGTRYEDIVKKVEKAEEMAAQNEGLNIDTVLFFDEANTTDALGMIKEVMVDRRVSGRKIKGERLQFIAACNPYRKHTEEMIYKLESAGLGYHVAAQQTRDKLGRIPLRHLVYRVHSLPASMRPLVWDFGQLKPEVEQLYTFQIVHRFVLQENQIPGDLQLVKALTAVFTASQRFMREQEDECSFVSLRDVERALKVMVWFYNHRDALRPLMDSEEESDDDDASENGLDDEEEDPLNQPLDEITRALVLSLGVCYQARLQDREPFRRAVAPSFSPPCLLPGGHEQIQDEITRCQMAVLDELELAQNIARNTALRENVFMMVVCIELRIPLFVVGKPGSSKSLAKTVVAGNMEGDASKSDLFKTFKQVHMVSYQCSPLSTAEGIKATFRQCSQLQEAKNPDKFVSVVVLDEVGLAEDSPLMPLKTLHPLLEDGVSSTDDEEQTREKVAFIGISNWALDPAKMNRGIMLSRGIPDTEELVDSAKGICSTTDERVQNLVEPLMEPLALGYEELYESQRESEALIKTRKDEFFGLRDFYSLVKMVYKIAEKLNREPAWKDIERAIRRNFGGLDEIDPVEIFREHFSLGNMRGPEPDPDELSALNLIKTSLERQITRGESRYLLVLTENYAALPIVLQELHEKKEEPIVIFGSSFPKDQEFTQVCRDINRIKVCMETGRTVILLNLESLYESLYDALNQYYVYFGGQKYVDLGLGSHRVKCRVDDKFRLIVIAERDVVYSKFPIPLINRLEKHYLVLSASLNTQQKNIVERIDKWVLQFSTVNIPRHQQLRTYTLGDSFVGYHADTAASVVLQVTKDLYGDGRRLYDNEEEVFRQSQELLLQCATPDAVARLPCTQLAQHADRLWSTYFTTQEHSSLTAFLKKILTTEERGEGMGSLIQITTHSRLLSSNDLQHVAASTLLTLSNILCLNLQQFQTEQQFCLSVRDFLAKLGGREGLLIVQCDAGDVNGNLIPCARHLLVEERASVIQDFKNTVGHDQSLVHIVMIVQLPRLVGGCQTFAGFQGGGWVSVHIDELRPPTGQIPAIEFMVDRSISELFDVAPSTTHCEEMEIREEEQEQIDIEMETSVHASNSTLLDKVDIISLLRSCIQAAVARIDDESRLSSRSTRRIEVMLNLLPDDTSQDTNLSFATILARRIHRLLEEKDNRAGSEASDWLRSEALSGTGIQESGTFRKALWQRVYSSVIPILSEVIAVVDRDSNLDLVSEEGTWLSRLWIAFFQDQTLVELHYDNFLSLESGIIRERAPVTTSGHGRHIFDVQFPFSWLIKERIDAMWKEATSISARRNITVQECLHDLISASEIGYLIEKAQKGDYGEAAVLHYLHDFVHMVHNPTVPGAEEKLISKAIITAARELHAQSHSLEDFSLSIPVVHVAHGAIEKRLSNLSNLIKCQPDVVTNLLRDIPSQESEMVYDAVALQLCLSALAPHPEEFDDPQTRLVWCNRVLAVRPSVENLLNSSTTCGEKTTLVLRDCRSIWQRASAVRLFIEHTCPGTLPCHPADVRNAFKLWKALGDETDFSKPEAIRVIEKFLMHCSEAVNKRCIRFGITTCPVCLEGLAEKDPVEMPCSHVVCLPCISNWIAQERPRTQCPVCKQDVPENFKITSTKAVRHAVQEHFDFRRRCNSFFMDLVSLFCFGSEAGMIDSDLFTIFMSYVLEARSKTKDFSPFPENGIDATPVVRSFLLQQLLRNSDEEVKKHLSHYMSEARGLRPDAGHLLDVCQLFVHCCEDSIIKKYAKLSNNLPAMIKLAQQLCVECTPSLTSSRSEPEREVDVVLLENVAKGRYVLGVTAEFMTLIEEESIWDNLLIKKELLSLIEAVKTMCCKSAAFSSPRLYLLKQLTRRFGVEVIHTLSERNELDWIVPLESRAQQQEDLVPDRFIIYGEHYKEIREAVAKTVRSGSHRELIATLESVALPPVVRDVILLLAEYREVTMCYRFTTAERRLSARGHEVLEEFLQDEKHLSDKARPLAVHLLNNTLGLPGMPSTRAAPGRSAMEQNLAELVIHTVTVLQCINHVTVCEPLRLMMENPAALKNSFLPTMPEDNLLEAMAGMKERGSWYQCPNGHPYYIGDCGRPVEVKVCPECKVNIGGTEHDLSTGNTVAQRADRTVTGHVLGDPAKRPKTLAPERSLSSVVVGITRILMHCALIEGACRQPQHVSAFINPTVPPAELSRFLWDHLQLDVELLAKSLGRSVDETILCVHMILACMTAHVSNLQQSMIAAPNLTSKESRKEWEMAFSSSVVTLTLTNLEVQIQHCHELMVGDNRLGNNPLMRLLYEVDVPADSLTGGILPSCSALWRYRTQVTLDHFSHTFQQEVSSTDTSRNKVLAEFLQQEHKLRALYFLPDIVKLQRLLMDQFHRRIDRAEAEKIKIRDFLKNKVSSKSTRQELASLIASFNKAWNHVRLNLDQQGRLRPPSDLCQTPMDNNRPLGLLLPNTSGMGICSLALVFYLTTVHNEFNARYQHLVGGKVEDLPYIPLQDVTSSQLISYDTERDLLPLILAQCNYSLEVGKGTLVQYNWDALERQLIDRFIRGRPLIEFKDERFAFSRDIQLDSVFAAVKLKIRQYPLNSTVSRQIITEIRSLTDICDVLSSLDIAIGFLSSTGGKSDMLLEEYLREVLRMDEQNCLRSLKAQQCCQLRHVVSFWRLLSLERARILIARGQDPFESISDTFKHVIPSTEMMKLSVAMKRIDLDSFVGEVLELIWLNLRMEPSTGGKEMSLGDFIQWHLDNKGHDPIHGLDQLPGNVKLKHVIAAWRTSVEFYDSYFDKREAVSA
ncbi:E3 ubiquitin-protein ligase rnf213-alpha-like isoform X2 [Acropora muricata]|uniref:E3 ubiquitin-protein ligase rnf213-alpha-like isoform X2 n=1 Tax=Acropora muricata TaxID=159855 RepID=UPI0034E48B55